MLEKWADIYNNYVLLQIVSHLIDADLKYNP